MNTKKKTFTKKDYNSSDGMMTSIWGPSLWHFLHTISFNYPCHPTKKDIDHYYNYMLSLKHILPCKYCRDNLPKNFKKTKFSKKIFKNRMTFSKWVYVLHEEINKMLGKKSGLTYNDVRHTYEQFRSRCIDTATKQCKVPIFEKGCTTPFYGVKSKCVLEVVPKKSKKKSFKISPSCIVYRKP